MHKRLLGMLLAVLLTAALCLPARAVELELSAPSAILMEKSTGEILYEQNSHEKLPPASVTKVMTSWRRQTTAPARWRSTSPEARAPLPP